MQRVRLLGELGELFGTEHEYHNLRHPADAIKLLCINKPAFKDYLLKSEENGIGFKVIQADAEMGYEDLLLPFGQRDLVVAPVLSGSGGGATNKILIGAGLIAISFLLPGAGLFGTTGLGGTLAAGSAAAIPAVGAIGVAGSAIGTFVGTALSAIGASLVLGGAAQLISPQPQVPQNFGGFGGNRFGSRNRTGGPVGVTRGLDGEQSYAYTGGVNTVGIGATVPVAYGKVLIGSHMLRAQVIVYDESDPLLTSIKKPGPETFLIGGEKITTYFSDVSGAVVRKTSVADVSTFKSSAAPGKINNVNLDINLADNATGTANVEAATTPSVLKKFNVALKLNKGFFDYAGGTGTTLVDAFVTYEVSVYKGASSTAQANLVSQDNATVQALLTSADAITWIHKMELPSGLGVSNWNVQVKIIDTNAAASTSKLTLVALGYELI